MRFPICIAILLLALPLSAQSASSADDFSLTVERFGCLGKCPAYKVTIQSDGTLKFDGRYYVHAKGTRTKNLRPEARQRLAHLLRDRDFFHMESSGLVVDAPATRIEATPNGLHNSVTGHSGEMELGDEIVKIAGIKRWI